MALQTFSFLFPIYIQGQPFLMIMMIINCFCGMVDRRKVFSLISSWDHCQRSSPSRISDTPRAGFEPAQNLSSGLVEWSCAVVITTTPRRQGMGNAAPLLQVLHLFVYWKYLLSQKYQKVLVLFSLKLSQIFARISSVKIIKSFTAVRITKVFATILFWIFTLHWCESRLDNSRL